MISKASFRIVLTELEAAMSEADAADLERRFGDDSGGVLDLEMLHLGQVGPRSELIWRHEERPRQLIKKRFQWWVPGKLK